jgi:hypothetical protein
MASLLVRGSLWFALPQFDEPAQIVGRRGAPRRLRQSRRAHDFGWSTLVVDL